MLNLCCPRLDLPFRAHSELTSMHSVCCSSPPSHCTHARMTDRCSMAQPYGKDTFRPEVPEVWALRSAPGYRCYLRSSCSPRLDLQHRLAECTPAHQYGASIPSSLQQHCSCSLHACPPYWNGAVGMYLFTGAPSGVLPSSLHVLSGIYTTLLSSVSSVVIHS